MVQISNPVTSMVPASSQQVSWLLQPVFTGSQFVLERFGLFLSIVQKESRSQSSDLPRAQGGTCPVQSSTPGFVSNQRGGIENPSGVLDWSGS